MEGTQIIPPMELREKEGKQREKNVKPIEQAKSQGNKTKKLTLCLSLPPPMSGIVVLTRRRQWQTLPFCGKNNVSFWLEPPPQNKTKKKKGKIKKTPNMFACFDIVERLRLTSLRRLSSRLNLHVIILLINELDVVVGS